MFRYIATRLLYKVPVIWLVRVRGFFAGPSRSGDPIHQASAPALSASALS